MKSWLKHPLRVTGRLSWLGAELLMSACSYAIHCAFRPQDSVPAARAMWLQTVLPFKSSLLEPAARQAHSLTAGLLQYELGDGDGSEEVCYWKDMTLVPHLINLLSKRRVHASVRFAQLREGSKDRKELAKQLHSEVLRLKESPAF